MTRYTPRHGGTPTARRLPSSRAMKRPVVGAGVAVALIASVGAAVATGEPRVTGAAAPALLAGAPATASSSSVTSPAPGQDSDEALRVASEQRLTASRSAVREEARLALQAKQAKVKRLAEAKRRKAAAEKQAKAERRIAHIRENPQPYAIDILHEYGFTDDQWGCLKSLWTGESDWTWDATNQSSGAYGIPQALPAEKMATAGKDWKTNPETQMRWGMKYIKDAYGSPCQAYQFWSDNNPHWY